MTKLTVAIMVRSLSQALSAAAQAAERGADLVEFRLDEFTSDKAAITTLIEDSPLPSIVTIRPTFEGGQYTGSDSDRIPLFQAACAGTRKPAYIDVELIAYQKSPELRMAVQQLVSHPGQVNPTDTGLLLSNHDFTSRPIDLYQRIEAMLAAPACRVMKIVWRARSLRDNIEAFQIIEQRHRPTIALCMGEEGLASRVLAKKFGALVTYVAVEDGAGTAPGQPSVAQIKSLYRWDQINAATQVFGVIGHPVGHSISPAFHNAGFDATGFNGIYLPMPIPPEYEHFKATVATWLACESLHFKGASVTIPHKQNLLRFVQETGGEIEPLSAKIGAANTLIVRPDGKLFACNTDYGAALDAVCDGLSITRDQLAGKRIAVLGAGGAARAIVAGFAHYGATVVIYNRTFDKAAQLASDFHNQPTQHSGSGSGSGSGSKSKVVAAKMDKLCDSCCEVYINCTSVGMSPSIDATAMDSAITSALSPGTVVFDTVYNPLETRLLREARAAGCVTISGAEMFIRQGADQFTRFTGRQAPLDVLRQVVMSKLSE